MFGKRSGAGAAALVASPAPAAAQSAPSAPPILTDLEPARSPRAEARAPEPVIVTQEARKSEEYYQTKGMIFGALIEAIDLAQLSRLEADAAREEIRDIVNEIIALKNVVMSIAEQEELLDDICNDVLGYGPLRAAARPRRHRRRDGERLGQDLHRGQRQDSADQHPLPRQSAADEHLP